ncbi:MAG: DUF4342 domain-containing protein [Thiogranum sp.]
MSEDKPGHSITENVTVSGNQLVDYVKNLIAAGNVRRLIIRKPNDEVLLEIPLTAGVAVGGALTAMAPVLAALGAMAALLTQFKVEIVRSDQSDDDT